MTYAEFTSKHNITFTIHTVYDRPDGLMEGDMFHYKVRIGCGRRAFTLYFSTGKGWTRTPELPDVLDSLASDAGSYENARNFEEWASDFGYNTDSRKAERIYRATKRQSEQLKRVLGTDAYFEMLEGVERL